ncbi:MAG TPA: DUF1559 domain-containing protein [Capsulimonadaceae bacterium]|jgi:prepilin-type N-terminal cleavage/methylation domain-containing protein
MNATKKSGFTLIELLVVIAIIAILAAILFPVFAKAREKARQVTCNSNLKQMGLGLLQYAQDYDEFLPCGRAAGGQGWAAQVYPYLKTWNLFQCPDDSFVPGNTAWLPISYAINQNANAPSGAMNPAPLSRFTSPSKTVLIFEINGGTLYSTFANETGSPAGYGYTGGNPNGATGYSTGNMGNRVFTGNHEPRHVDGSTFLAGDGHTKFLSGEKVSTYNIPASSTTPGNLAGTGAAGTDSMVDTAGNSYTMTFSYR